MNNTRTCENCGISKNSENCESVTYYCGFNFSNERDRLVYNLESKNKNLMSLRGVMYDTSKSGLNDDKLMAEVIRDCVKYITLEMVNFKRLRIDLVVRDENSEICKKAAEIVNRIYSNVKVNIISETDQYGECKAVYIKNTYGLDSIEYKNFQFKRTLQSVENGLV